MKKLLLFILLIVFFVFFVSSQEEMMDDDDEKIEVETHEEEETKLPKIIAHKTGPIEAIKNTNITFEFTIYNVGESAAFDVTIDDVEWDKELYDFIEGTNKKDFEKIDPNSHVKYSYSIKPKTFKSVDVGAATIIYKIAEGEGEELQRIAMSTDLPKISVLSQNQFNKKNEGHWKQWLIFLFTCCFPLGIPIFAHINSNNKIQRMVHQSSKKKKK